MAAYDLQEQEQIDAIKDWWKENGKTVIASVIAAALAFGAVKAWQANTRSKSETAAQLFENVDKAVKDKDAKKITEAAEALKTQFPASAYTARAALVAAKAGFDAKELDAARTQLQWVVDKSPEAGFKNLARLRLAGVLLDQKKYDDALKTLDELKDEAFAARAQDLRGDIFVAQAKLPEARGAYRAALAKEVAGSATKPMTQIKLDAIGDDK